ncbi:Cupin domain protein [Aquimixticola soesokkakensis]|uniref:Cupin domain protein n=1 Tax=Aquimixticola soesokkakensis TaxID=1519096 RepID=A0A1Y5RQ45_9RHOB|nr:cupin domain-containing protein [Aquimixticola soesokkakensis]SLN22726.1 Cupin domain protein [Aquimixticola soesokkakensis]
MRNIIPNPEEQFPETFKSLWLNGPEGGVDSCNFLISRVPPGHRGPRLHTHPVDQFYVIFEGQATVQIGRDVFKVGPMAMVHFPAGTPHCNWNETDAYEKHLELMVPRPPQDRLIEYWEGEVPEVPDAAALITPITPDGYTMGRLFASQHLARRETGSEHARIYAAQVPVGAGGPALHFHDFDQFYYVYGGELTIQVGHERAVARTGDLVMLPKGCVHTNLNLGTTPEYHLAILIPEPASGTQFDYKVQIDYSTAPPFVNEPEGTLT